MNNNFLGKGWSFPLTVNTRGGVALAQYEEKVKQSILLILETAKGERVMRPDFGCGIHDYVFTVIDTAALTLIQNSIKEALLIWEPRIQVIGVKTSTGRLHNGILDISIDYKLHKTNTRHNLVYPFYLDHGGWT